jgi:hypothetical protein
VSSIWREPLEGYASVFGFRDLVGDVVRAGAFRRTLSEGRTIPMLVHHDPRLRAGVWREVREDARGLIVRGGIDPQAPAAALASTLLRTGLDGLSIGFTPRRTRSRVDGGRDLIEATLWEVSLVSAPMCPPARLFRRAHLARTSER